MDWLISDLRKIDSSYDCITGVKGVARYLRRNSTLLNIEVEPKLIDVLVFRSFSGEYIYATLSESAEHRLLKAWDLSWSPSYKKWYGKANKQILFQAFKINQKY